MVDVKELRVGNWVAVGLNQSTVTAVTWNSVQLMGNLITNRISQVSPIPITPEILEQLGFRQDNEFDDTFRLGDFDVYYRKGYCEWVVDDRGNNEGTKPRLIKYLHNLQNVYYSHTNEELIFQSIKELK